MTAEQALLFDGYAVGPELDDVSDEGGQRWLREATEWWKGLASWAQREGLDLYCYRGYDEYWRHSPRVSAVATLLDPRTSCDEWRFDFLDRRKRGRAGSAVDYLEQLRSIPAPTWRGEPGELAGAYERLCSRGSVKRRPVQRRLFRRSLPVTSWMAALTDMARADGRPIQCTHYCWEAELLDPATRRHVTEVRADRTWSPP